MVLKLAKENNKYVVYPFKDRFDVPEKLYGKIPKLADMFFKSFLRNDKTTGVLLTGNKGTGKTELGNLLANKAISYGMPVILVSDVSLDMEFLKFFSNLRNTVVFFDEFGKTVHHGLQSKMLTALSDMRANKNLLIFTENATQAISNFILNRPGRVRFHIDFEKVEEEVILEYCEDRGVSYKFLTDLVNLYKSSSEFSFDHLRELVDSHLEFPELTIDELLTILNMKFLSAKRLLKVSSAILESEEFVLNNFEQLISTDEKMFKTGRSNVWLSVKFSPKPKDKKEENTNNEPDIGFGIGMGNGMMREVYIYKKHVVEWNSDYLMFEVEIPNIGKLKGKIKIINERSRV